jgi:glycosyltransferase involved in cell wall biosynthesis
MRVVFALDQRYASTQDGAVWVKTGFAYDYWTRFLEVFDEVRVVARVRLADTIADDFRRVDGDCVAVTAIPHYLGPWQYLAQAPRVRRIAQSSVTPGDAVILFGGSPISDCIQSVLRPIGYPYAAHVGTDPFDVFAPGSVKHPLRPFFRWWSPRALRRLCEGACASAYVTERALQRRYPCRGRQWAVSDVCLPEEAWVSAPRPVCAEKGSLGILMVGTLAQLYKAPDTLIDAIGICARNGLDLRLTIVGDGRHRSELEQRVRAQGLENRVFFRGQLPAGREVRAEMDRADVFVLASHQEGLPRAMVEAMARGLPCIGSTVGGIPELLPAEDMVPPGDSASLARKIIDVCSDPTRMARMSERNLKKAGEYREDLLRERRLEFYRYVRQRTEEWLQVSV